jgi:general secretion pathway protein B
MSYILEALKKSDQQRQQGAAPTLPSAQVVVAQPLQRAYFGLFAAVLLGAGMLIGWLRPWQGEPPALAVAPIPLRAPLAAAAPENEIRHEILPQAGESAGSRELQLKQSARELPLPNISSPIQVMPLTHAAPPLASAVKDPLPMAELPVAIQRELPSMTIQLHAYSGNPAERLVSINSHMLEEGGILAPGLKLEQITPDGMIFSYKGYRFLHGVR